MDSKDNAFHAPRQKKCLLALAIMIGAVLACSLGGPENVLPTEPATPTQVTGGPTYAPIVTATPFVQFITATPGETNGCAADSKALGARYELATTIDMDSHSASTTMQATYRNDTSQALSQIVLNVEPNRRPGVFTLEQFQADNLASYTLTGPRLEATLKKPLASSCEITFNMDFTARPGVIAQTYVGNLGYFGYTDRQFNLGVWLPEFAPFVNGGFFTPKAWPLGEYEVSDWSDFTASVKVQGKDADKQQVIGPGEMSKDGDVWHFRLQGARTFTLSVSAAQSQLSAKSDDGITIDLYYFSSAPKALEVGTQSALDVTSAAGAISVSNTAQFALETARTALNRYTKIYGPLPYTRVVVVEGDFQDGMEFSGLVFVSQHYFSLYDGITASWLTLITAHEIAHQWWYSLVGDDQGAAPYMDESLAIYSELLYLEEAFPALTNWWWTFRVNSYTPAGYVDSKIYDFQNLRLYLNAVYLRGALMLQEIRKTMGDEAFFKWLRDVRSAQAGRIATPIDLWSAMSADDYTRTAPIRVKYLHNPDPLHPPPATDPCCG